MVNTRVLVVLGKGFEFRGKEPVEPLTLSVFSQLNVIAAMILANKKNYDVIIFSGGPTVVGAVSEARAMANYYENICGDNNKEVHIICEEDSMSTFDSAKNVKRLMDLNGFAHQLAHVLTVGFHLPRAKAIFKHFLYTNAEYLAADQVIGSSALNKCTLGAAKQRRALYYKAVFKEWLLRMINHVDPNNRITQFIIQKYGRSEFV